VNAGSQNLDSEDAKILTLARATKARNGAPAGAAVRDTNGRTYAGATVDLPSLRLSALQVAVALAVSSGAEGLEAAALVTDEDGELSEEDVAAVGDLGGSDVPVFRAGADGQVAETRRT
jgi:hypothetical protein